MPFKIIVMELRTLKDLFEERRPIKALSIWEPWASLVARGVKRHETRHWSTTYRGPIAIHAAKTLDLAGAPEALCVGALGLFWHKDRPTGVVVAIGELRNVHRAEDVAGRLTRADAAAGNFGYGRFAWEIAKVRPLRQPVPLVGRQGLFNWTPPDDIEERLGDPLDHAAICHSIGWGYAPQLAGVG